MAYPRFQRSRAHKFINITSGDITLPTAKGVIAGAVLGIEAQVGDALEFSLNVQFNSSDATNYADWDVATMNGTTPINFLSQGTTTAGFIGGWTMRPIGFYGMQGTFLYNVVANDILNGVVTAQLYGIASAAARAVFAKAGSPLQFSVKNIGPVDPN